MILVDLPREAILAPGWWSSSPPVPRRARPERAPRSAPASPTDSSAPWRLALAALSNAGERSLTYDDWRNVIFAIHHETGGSDEGLALAHEFSGRSAKHDPAFLDNRVWPYVKAGGGITGRTVMSIASRVEGWHEPLSDADFEELSAGHAVGLPGGRRPGAGGVGPAAPAPVGSGRDGGSGGRDGAGAGLVAGGEGGVYAQARRLIAAAGEVLAPVERRGIPPAKHLCTDQANAARLVRAFGDRLLVAGGRWHVWDGRRWAPDEGEVYRLACRLSEMAKDEARGRRERRAEAVEGMPDVAGRARADDIADALEKWSAKCEMRGTIEAAVGLARKMLEVDVDLLDRDPWSLNVLNGVVDLRTGALRAHSPGELMTRLAPVRYEGPGDGGEFWGGVVRQIAGSDEVAAFLQRWFGYCCTGDVSEQVFVVHWGDGANGKSTVLDTVAGVLGDYAASAAPGLVAGGDGDRHPTEIADLRGRRMVTAHESREGVCLREDFVKQATGGDRLKARFMREDFFEFKPTHKLQLLTNAKPVVKGQDHGIWRRVRLVRYGERFGTAEDVAAGRASCVRSFGVVAGLLDAVVRSHVLGWLVQGAMRWAHEGLCEPESVLAESERYRFEQDRVRQWASECCDFGSPEACEPLTMGMSGLMPDYTEWCRENGYHSLGRQRFVDELCRAYPRLRVRQAHRVGDSGKRRKVTEIVGIRLLGEN